MKELIGKRCRAILRRDDTGLGCGFPWWLDILAVDMPMVKVDCWSQVMWLNAADIVSIEATGDMQKKAEPKRAWSLGWFKS